MDTPKRNDGSNFWLVAWPILTAVMASGFTWWMMERQRAVDLSLRPPIVVMEVSEWVRLAGDGATDKARFQDGANKAVEAAKSLEAQGVLVLDSRIVRGAPKHVYVSTPDRSNHGDR